MYVQAGVPRKSQFLPADCGKGTVKEEMVDILYYLIIAKHTDGVWLDMKISPLKHVSSVQSIQKNEPGEEFEPWCAL